MSRQRTTGTVAIVAGAAVAIVGGVALVHGVQDDNDNTSPPISAAGTPSPGSPAGSQPATSARASAKATSKPSGKPSSEPSGKHAANRSHRATAVPNPTSNSTPALIANPAGAACIPKSLTVSSVGIAGERVVPMGTNAQGQIYPPAHTTMWYDRSPSPARTASR